MSHIHNLTSHLKNTTITPAPIPQQLASQLTQNGCLKIYQTNPMHQPPPSSSQTFRPTGTEMGGGRNGWINYTNQRTILPTTTSPPRRRHPDFTNTSSPIQFRPQSPQILPRKKPPMLIPANSPTSSQRGPTSINPLPIATSQQFINQIQAHQQLPQHKTFIPPGPGAVSQTNHVIHNNNHHPHINHVNNVGVVHQFNIPIAPKLVSQHQQPMYKNITVKPTNNNNNISQQNQGLNNNNNNHYFQQYQYQQQQQQQSIYNNKQQTKNNSPIKNNNANNGTAVKTTSNSGGAARVTQNNNRKISDVSIKRSPSLSSQCQSTNVVKQIVKAQPNNPQISSFVVVCIKFAIYQNE
jgi:hypothetical protein